jgi:hypothetical protein
VLIENMPHLARLKAPRSLFLSGRNNVTAKSRESLVEKDRLPHVRFAKATNTPAAKPFSPEGV